LAVLGVCALVGLAVVPVASSRVAAKSPTCSTVSAAIVNATMGGGAVPVGVSSSSNGQLDCDYGGTHNVNINYRTNQTAANFKLIIMGYSSEKKIAGIGASAYSGVASTLKPPLQFLFVLDGTYVFVVSGSTTTVAAEEALAKKVLPLI